MHLQLAADAPVLLRAAAFGALVLHVGGASLAMASGAVALAARKGGRLHRAAGQVFFGAMLTMSGVAAVVAPLFPDRISALMGAFTFYLTVTGWLAVRRPADAAGRVERVAGLGALAIVAAGLWLGGLGALAPKGLLDDLPFQIAIVVAVVASLAAASDLRLIRRGGIAGPARIRRHVWRMCAALFIAFGSAAGQIKVVELMPAMVRHSALLQFSPALSVLALMVFWLVRTRAPRRRRPTLAVA
jgi:uncharacterized membrane protein